MDDISYANQGEVSIAADDVSSRTSAALSVLMEKMEKARQRFTSSKSALEARWGDRVDTKRYDAL